MIKEKDRKDPEIFLILLQYEASHGYEMQISCECYQYIEVIGSEYHTITVESKPRSHSHVQIRCFLRRPRRGIRLHAHQCSEIIKVPTI